MASKCKNLTIMFLYFPIFLHYYQTKVLLYFHFTKNFREFATPKDYKYLSYLTISIILSMLWKINGYGTLIEKIDSNYTYSYIVHSISSIVHP